MTKQEIREHCNDYGYSDEEVGAFNDGYQQGRADENKRIVDILHNFYEVRNAEQNAFMDMLVMEIMREQLKENNIEINRRN